MSPSRHSPGNNLGRRAGPAQSAAAKPGQKDLRGWEWRYLWQQTHSDAMLPFAEKSEIVSLAVSDNDNLLGIGMVFKDGLFVWDLRTRQELLISCPGRVKCASPFPLVNPDGVHQCQPTPLRGRREGTLRLWNPTTRNMVAEFPLTIHAWDWRSPKMGGR